MSEQRLVSPLLDGFQVGDPISSHDGVRCCPAIKESTDNKYIVKILSIPASQSQLDALLLAGAYQDAASALEYFKDLADGVVKEIKLHQQLARLDGFVPCEAWQVVPMDDNRLGYEVYLLTPYHRTLDRHLKKTPLTHLEAVNLGLDICAALTASRRAGHLYVDLKPSNIFIASDREFLIGDLGFLSLDSLNYAALPSKYRSGYTAPEMQDALATISDTADIYALGLIMYQVYNDGQLPAEAEDGIMAAPANADYEMAEIILKACAADPAERWQDPAQMGQALVSYMQRNTVNDVPILPPDLTPAEPEEPAEEEAAEEETVEEATEETAEETASEEDAPAEEAETEEETEAEEEPAEEEAASAEESEEETPAEEPASEEASEEAPVTEEPAEETEEVPAEETEEAEENAEEEAAPEEAAEPEALEETEETEETEESEVTEETAEPETEEESPVSEELAFIEALESDEAEPEEAEESLENAEISEETSAILAQADELAALEVPEPVVVTAPQLPEEPVEETAPEAEEDAPANASLIQELDEDEDGEDEVDIPIAIPDLAPIKKAGKKWLVTLLILALLAGAAYGGYYYYENYYLIPVESIVLDGSCDEITAEISVPLDEALLTAVCTDTYGNTVTSPVVDGKAHFQGLNPGSQYTVTLRTESFNQLVGNNTAAFTTDQQTEIVSFSATTGAEDGDVILSFTVNGFDAQNWNVEYAAEDEDAQSMTFTGHMATITGLTVGKTYTFTLSSAEDSDVQMVGQTDLEFAPSKVVLAQNVGIGSFEEDVLTLVWTAPEDAEVASWTVHCTSDGYDETLTVTEPTAQFQGIETGKTYAIEILADGMTQSSRTEITATPLTISNLEAAMVNDYTIRVTWEFAGEAPAGGWSVRYAIEGETIETLTSDTNAADLPLVIPGASYEITVQGVDTAAVSSVNFETPAASKFGGNLSYSFCVTPSADNWTHKSVKDYTTSFKASQSISMVVFNTKKTSTSGSTKVLYVVRDSDGKLLPDLCAVQSVSNKTMWNDLYFYPTLPETPSSTGTYTFELYFDGALVLSKDFKIVK